MRLTPSPLADKVWESWKTHLKATKGGTRFEEHHRTTKADFKDDNSSYQREFQRGQVKLEPGFKTYEQVKALHSETKKDGRWKGVNVDEIFDKHQPLDSWTTLRYTFQVIGDPPPLGYPLYIGMHGGGNWNWSWNEKRDPTVNDWKGRLQDAVQGNDGQWMNMTRAYQDAIKSGVWISLRGIGDTWDLHFTRAGYVLVEKLIENMILFGVKNLDGAYRPMDASRVHLLGFSAGGDGVYRLANRLSQRFAAVNMGGGDPGNLVENLTNLMNTPICLQVGEHDDAGFDRNKNVAKSGYHLDTLQAQQPALPRDERPDVYRHEVFIHVTAPEPISGDNKVKDDDLYVYRHFLWDAPSFWYRGGPDNPRLWYKTIADWRTWLAQWDNNNNGHWLTPGHNDGLSSDRKSYNRILNDQPTRADNQPVLGRAQAFKPTNAIDWVTGQKARPTMPIDVVWDIRCNNGNDNFTIEVFTNMSGRGEDGKGRSQNYWLDIDQYTFQEVGTVIKARLDTAANTVFVTSAKYYLRILLRPEMITDFSNVKVVIGGKTLTVKVNTDNKTVIMDTVRRSDPSLIFNADIVLRQDLGSGVWSASSSPYPTSNTVATPKL